MALTMLCLTVIVFFMISLEPNLKKLAISQTEARATQEQLDSWLQRNGYRQGFWTRYGQWLGIVAVMVASIGTLGHEQIADQVP